MKRKPTAIVESISLAFNSQIAGLRVMGTRQIEWFDKLFQDNNCISVGRTNGRHVRIRDDSVSRLHCMVEKLAPGRYRLVDCLASNGLFVSHFGRFTDYQEVKSVELSIFMRIKLGSVKLAPVLKDGKSPLIATTGEMFALEACEVYGSPHAATKITGLPISRISRLANQFREVLSKRKRGKRKNEERAKRAKTSTRKKAKK